jgi:predicted hotdog family 3-hydroxylacyl-ACP dehydratase
MLLTKEETANIIPQKAPFVMIDSLLEADEKSFTSNFIAEESNIFSKDGKLYEPALIENIAQTVAAGFSYIDRKKGGEPQVGFIGGISKLKIHLLPKIGDQITTTVTMQYQFENIFLVKGENFVGEKPLVECEMKIVVGV